MAFDEESTHTPDISQEESAPAESAPIHTAPRESIPLLIIGILVFLLCLSLIWWRSRPTAPLEQMPSTSDRTHLQTYLIGMYAYGELVYPQYFSSATRTRTNTLALDTAESWKKQCSNSTMAKTRGAACLNAAILYGFANDLPAARQALTRAAQVDPQQAPVYRALAPLYEEPSRAIPITPALQQRLAASPAGPLLKARIVRAQGDQPGERAALQPLWRIGIRLITLNITGILLLLGSALLALIIYLIRKPIVHRQIAQAAQIDWTPGSWGIGQALILISLFFFIQLGLSLALHVFTHIHPTFIALIAFPGSAIFSIGIFLVGCGQRPWNWGVLGWRPAKWSIGYGLTIMLCFIPVIMTLLLILSNFVQPEQQRVIQEMLHAPNIWVQLGLALLATVGAPLVEESIFRGALFRALQARITLWPAAVLSGLIFALVHGSVIAILPFTVIGVIFAIIAWRSRTLWASAVAHAVYNGMNTVLILLLTWALQGAPGG